MDTDTHRRFQAPWLESVPIAVSNNIDEKELARLAQEVDGTVLVGTAVGFRVLPVVQERGRQ